MNLKKLLVIVSISLIQIAHADIPQDSATPQKPIQPPAAPINVDETILAAFERVCQENKAFLEKSHGHGIEFQITRDFIENQHILTLRTIIDLDELEKAKETLPIEKTFLRAILLDAYRKKLESEDKKVIKGNQFVLLVNESTRTYRPMGNLTKCHIILDDNWNNCLECKMFIDALKFQQLKNNYEKAIHTAQ